MEGISEYFQVSREEIEALLRQMPLTAGVPEMLKRLKDLDAVFIIVSDANAVFIGEPLASANLLDLFDKIFTNPAEFDDQGRLNMRPFSEQVKAFFNYQPRLVRHRDRVPD